MLAVLQETLKKMIEIDVKMGGLVTGGTFLDHEAVGDCWKTLGVVVLKVVSDSL